MRSYGPISLAALLVTIFLSAPSDSWAQKILTGTISTNTTLDTVGGAIYEVTGNVTVNSGVTLTIDPGVVLKFNLNLGLTINGELQAVGTSIAPIYFTSIRDDNSPAPGGDDTNGDGGVTVPTTGDWKWIQFNDTASDLSTLEECIIQYAGRSNTAAIICNDASPSVINCELAAAYQGVRCNGASDPFLSNTGINAMTDVPVAIELEADPVFDNLAFESTADNGFDAIGLLGGTLSGSNTLRVRGATLGASPISNFVYILLSDVTIAPGGTLTIEPSIVIKPKAGVDIFVQGTLIMDGTATPGDEIIVTSFKDDNAGTPNDTNNDGSTTSPAKGDWSQIEFQDGSTGSVSFATIRFGGTTSEGIVRCVNTSPPLDNLTISDSTYGIEQQGTSASVISNCSVSNTTNTPFFQSVTANPTYTGNTFTNVGLSAIGIIGETIGVNGSLPQRTVAGFTNITYWLEENLIVSFGSTLTIDPGVVLKFNNPSSYPFIDVQGAFIANASAGNEIVFTSQYDDDVGNPADTEGNGTATVPDDGQWGYIKFSATSDDLTCILNHCVLSYGGQQTSTAYRGAVWCNSSAPTISNCQFNTNETGIRTDGTASPIISDNDFFNNDEVPLATSVVANPQYSGNTFNQNFYHAIGILSETLAQDAILEQVTVGGPPQFTEFFPYLHLGTLTIGSGSTLTIEPDVVVKVLSGQRPIDCNGGLTMNGVAPDQLVVYTSILDDSFGGDSNTDGSATSPASGNWNQIRYNASTIDANSTLENCLFRFASSGNRGVIEMQSASPTIQNCEFELNNYGLWMQNQSDPVVQNNLFRLTSRAPISKSILANPTFSGNVYDNNSYDVLGLIGEPIGQDLTVSQWNVAGYTNITRTLVGTTLTVNFGAKLTISPGVVLKLGRTSGGPFQSLITVAGALSAFGTVADPIVFTSINDDAYGNPADTNNDGSLTTPAQFDWQQIIFQDVSDDANSILNECILSYAGWQGQAVLMQTASPTVSNCTFDTNWNYGIRIEGDSQPVIVNSTFGNHLTTPIVMSLGADPIFAGNVFLPNNAYHALGILGETLASDALWKKRSMAQTESIPYILVSDLTAGLGAILRIEPGVVIKPLSSSVDIIVRRGLIAEGTPDPEGLIVFTSPRDDFYGGDTNNDGTDTDPSTLRWGSVKIENEAIDDSTRFSNCVFRYATNSSAVGALNVTNANPQVDDCTFTNNGVGVNFVGASGDPTKGHVNDCDIYGNSFHGIKNTGMSFVVDATNNWWGDATGPLDASDDTGTGGFYNPGGLGDVVTDMVDYGMWDTTGIQNVLLGDVSLNGDVRAFDSSLVLQDLALLISLSPLQTLLADVDCSGLHSTLDAANILRYVAGLDAFLPCAFESVPTKGSAVREKYAGSEPGDFQVSFPSFSVDPGQLVSVPIGVSGSGELLGHEYRLTFDPGQVSIEDVVLSPAAQGATVFWNQVDGEVRIALASAQFLPVAPAVELLIRGADTLAGTTVVDVDLIFARLNEQEIATGPTGTPPQRQSWRLDQNQPNPFNPSTNIVFSVPGEVGDEAQVRVVVYDLRGRAVRHLVEGPRAAGEHLVTWNGRDDAGRAMASGVYLYRLEAGGNQATRKMLLLK